MRSAAPFCPDRKWVLGMTSWLTARQTPRPVGVLLVTLPVRVLAAPGVFAIACVSSAFCQCRHILARRRESGMQMFLTRLWQEQLGPDSVACPRQSRPWWVVHLQSNHAALSAFCIGRVLSKTETIGIKATPCGATIHSDARACRRSTDRKQR